ncbi:serine hydrolase domain-containing protein [Streptomyces alkaliterrae]|uniref:Beta-lactamase family protein n=1 Tax=Streptomyces alkaliterrae TaxID=2213162 RepID=A0A5P0YW45_9ACTN|nr:serine hydrolase domain-containing protein [Streptomyces alkaliterrae]MBB1255804.1 beta-lactamase family protein [Streptomyces alkaliterrae]MBB1261834.1 beta-lactamase family protein [Streptomyces alkaliterrae]MQS04515.1 serine hydrolase [Streptomyces alkaliterrae]
MRTTRTTRAVAATAALAALLTLAPAQAATALAGPAAAPGHGLNPGPDRASTGRSSFQADVSAALREADFVSLAGELRVDGRSARARAGVADLRTGAPVPARTTFRIASTTKTFVAVTLLQLVGEGRLSLDDPVERWLPGVVRGNGNDGNAVTVRNLLQNTSGIHNYTDILEDEDSAAEFERHRFLRHTPEQLVALAMRHQPSFPPAHKDDPKPDWEYSNTNFVLAGMVIKAVTGNNWRVELDRRILRPLRLTDTHAPGLATRLRGPHARSYHRFEDSEDYTDTTVRDVTWADAAGELVSSHRDVHRFFTALLAGGLLRPAEQRAMLRTVPMPGMYQDVWPGARYGLGIMSQSLPCGGVRWNHGGDLAGTTARNSFTADGRFGISLVSSGKRYEDQAIYQQEAALQKVIDRSLCASGAGSSGTPQGG